MSESPESVWIRAYALAPRRLSDGGWLWLKPYEWRWHRPAFDAPSVLNPPRIVSRKAAKVR